MSRLNERNNTGLSHTMSHIQTLMDHMNLRYSLAHIFVTSSNPPIAASPPRVGRRPPTASVPPSPPALPRERPCR